MSRTSELLRAAAGALEDGIDPFSPGFLSEHEVTYDEVLELSDQMPLGALAAAWVIENPHRAVKIVQAGLLGARADVVTEALSKLLERS